MNAGDPNPPNQNARVLGIGERREGAGFRGRQAGMPPVPLAQSRLLQETGIVA